MTTKKKTTKRATKPRKPAATKKTAAAKKKSKLTNLTQTNGKAYEQSIESVRKLEDILEVRKTNPYGTGDLRIFEANLATMNLSEMQEVAVRSGVFPSGNKTVLKNKLIKAFKNEGFGVVDTVIDKGSPVQLDPADPNHKEIIDYLNNT